MIALKLPLSEIPIDLHQDVDLAGMPEDEAIQHLELAYAFLSPARRLYALSGQRRRERHDEPCRRRPLPQPIEHLARRKNDADTLSSFSRSRATQSSALSPTPTAPAGPTSSWPTAGAHGRESRAYAQRAQTLPIPLPRPPASR